MKVSVAVRQKFHGFHLASELNKHQILDSLFTSFYGNLLFKRNDFNLNIEKAKVKNNYFSAFRTYCLKQNSFESDDYFGRWVSKNLLDEDIIVTWGIQALPIIKKAKERGIKVVLERGSSHVLYQRNIMYEEYERFKQSKKSLDVSFQKKRIDRECLEYELADYISIPSSFVKRTFLENGVNESKLFQNPYGVNLDLFQRNPIQHDTFRIIYAGSISIRKGVQYLIEAFAKLKMKNSELWLVGEVDESMNVLLKNYSNNSVKVFSAVTQHELSKMFNMCDVFVIYSIEEGMAMVQAQAMSCGLPIICTTNTGGDDIVEDGINGYVLPIRRADLLAERLEFLYLNRNLVLQMGSKSHEIISKNYTWSKYGERAKIFFSTIVK